MSSVNRVSARCIADIAEENALVANLLRQRRDPDMELPHTVVELSALWVQCYHQYTTVADYICEGTLYVSADIVSSLSVEECEPICKKASAVTALFNDLKRLLARIACYANSLRPEGTV